MGILIELEVFKVLYLISVSVIKSVKHGGLFIFSEYTLYGIKKPILEKSVLMLDRVQE